MKCLEKNPGRRYDTASALAEDLGRFLADEPVNARPADRLRRSIAWLKKRPWVVSGITSLMLLLFACGAYGLWAEIRERGLKIQLLQARVARLSSPPRRDVASPHYGGGAIRPDVGYCKRLLTYLPPIRGPGSSSPRSWRKDSAVPFRRDQTRTTPGSDDLGPRRQAVVLEGHGTRFGERTQFPAACRGGRPRCR